MEAPKFNVGDVVKVEAKITNIKCYSLSRGWMYELSLEGRSLEDMQLSVVPTVHERALELK